MSPRCLWSHGGPQTPLMRFLLRSFQTKAKRHVPVCRGVPRPPRPLTCPFSVQSHSSQGRLPGTMPRAGRAAGSPGLANTTQLGWRGHRGWPWGTRWPTPRSWGLPGELGEDLRSPLPFPQTQCHLPPPLPVASCFSKRRDRVGCCGEAREAIAGASQGQHSKLSPPPRRLIEKTSTLKTTGRAKVRRKQSFERSKLCLINKHCTISSQTGFTDENLKVCPRYLLHEIRTAVGRCASRGPPRLQRGAV